MHHEFIGFSFDPGLRSRKPEFPPLAFFSKFRKGAFHFGKSVSTPMICVNNRFI